MVLLLGFSVMLRESGKFNESIPPMSFVVYALRVSISNWLVGWMIGFLNSYKLGIVCTRSNARHSPFTQSSHSLAIAATIHSCNHQTCQENPTKFNKNKAQ